MYGNTEGKLPEFNEDAFGWLPDFKDEQSF